jgi:hypothetical protein
LRSLSSPPSTNQEASISAFVILFMLAVFALMGLVVDGGSALSAQQAASDEAEQAARAGAGQLSIDALRSGVVQLNQSKAISEAEQFTVDAGHPGIATVSAGTVTVQIEYQMPTVLLGMIHIPFITISATASAVDVQGVTVGS